MEKELYFEKVNQIGNLYLECILYEFEYEPILFVCSDECDNLYLCACSEMRKEQRWLITNTNYNILHDLTTHKIDIKTAMTDFFDKKYIITRGLDCKETSLPIMINDINLLDIPKENVYLNYFNKEATEEFLEKISKDYNSTITYYYSKDTTEPSLYDIISTSKVKLSYKNVIKKIFLINEPTENLLLQDMRKSHIPCIEDYYCSKLEKHKEISKFDENSSDVMLTVKINNNTPNISYKSLEFI